MPEWLYPLRKGMPTPGSPAEAAFASAGVGSGMPKKIVGVTGFSR